MPITFHQLGRSLIALAVILATSLASEADACSTKKSSPTACTMVGACCSPGATKAPRSVSDSDAGRITPVSQSPASCRTSPGGACSCRSQDPAAPTPKPAQGAAEGRSELAQASVFASLGEHASARDLIAARIMPAQSPPKTPLYLRNARLLF